MLFEVKKVVTRRVVTSGHEGASNILFLDLSYKDVLSL